MPADAELEAAILANPDDDAAYLVYADYLMARDDPRGQLIVIQAQAEEEPEKARRAVLRKAAGALIDQHREYFLGPLAKLDPSGKRSGLVWRCGYVRKLELEWEEDMDPDEADRQLATILVHPSYRFIIELELGPLYDWEGDAHVQGFVDTLVAIGQPEALRLLQLSRPSLNAVSTASESFGELIAKLTRLRRITIRERALDKARPTDPIHELSIRRRKARS
ncbi:MAG: TIGR02996 domain-containing protein [Kofleriaceae bacterium]